MIEVPARVKDALRSGSYKKEYRIIAYQDDGETAEFTIDNDNLVYESVTIDERMCSGSDLKFGLCEGSSLEFQYMPLPKVEGITAGMDLTNVPFYMKDGWSAPIGETLLLTATNGYSYYTDNTHGMGGYFSIIYGNGSGVDIGENVVTFPAKFPLPSGIDSCVVQSVNANNPMLSYFLFELYTINKGRKLQVFIDVQYKDTDGVIKTHSIPMGWFTVDSISRQASTGIVKVVAYNKLKSEYLNVSIKNKILEFMEDGLGGYMDKIAVGVILESLMGGYQGTKETPVTPASMPSDNQSALIYYYNICDSNKNKTNYWLFAYCKPTLLIVERPGDDYYRFEIKNRQLCKYLEDYSLANPVTGANMSPLDFLVSWTGYKPPSGSAPKNNAVTVKEGLKADLYSPNVPPKMMEYIIRYRQVPEWPTLDIALDRRIYNDGYDNETELTNWFANLRIEEHEISLSGDIPCGGIMFYLPTAWKTVYFASGTSPSSGYDPFTENEKDAAELAAGNLVTTYSQAFKMSLDSIEGTTISLDELLSLSSVTLRELQSAVFEVQCKYGKLSRTLDIFEGVTLDNTGLYPAEDLYPANNLYPAGVIEAGYPAMYSKLWADEGNIRTFRNLNITYKTTETIDEQEQTVEKVLQVPVNLDGTDDYNMTDNWLFRNLVWTDSQVEQYANAMVQTLQGIRWFPYEMWCAGLPYIEPGDGIEIDINDQSYPSYVLRRTLNGIQNLADTMINGTLDIF